MNTLNPELYSALLQAFGTVHIVNPGQPAHYTTIKDWFDTPLQRSHIRLRPKMNVDMWGEVYSTCCPKCNDKRFRLYISHVWGVHNEQADRKFYPIKCHNEGCDWGTLIQDLTDTGKRSFQLDPTALVATPQRKMEYPCDFELLIPVNKLASNHPVIEYLTSRGFTDLDLLANEYQFHYCPSSPWHKMVKDSNGVAHTITPANRLIIPNIQAGVWAGWQARYSGPIPNDPKTGKPLIQKYLNAPGYSFGSTVYRLQQAKEFTAGQFCIVSEGALSALACGFAGVCTFGMFPKPMQEALLAEHFAAGQIVFLVEHEAAANKRIYSCAQRLNNLVAKGCLTVDLPVGKDAANLTATELMVLIANANKLINT